MKILAIVSTLDLQYRLGCTPAWWQLLKGLYEAEVETVVAPYLGAHVESPWWRSASNPMRFPSQLYFNLDRKFLRGKGVSAGSKGGRLVAASARALSSPVWQRHLADLLRKERDIDAVVFFNIPLNQIRGIPSNLRRDFGIKTVFYDGDLPTVLPETNVSRGFLFNYYVGADLSEFDIFITNSEGITDNLRNRGAKNIHALHYAADPELFRPVASEKVWDLAFFGYGSESREEWLRRMITAPSNSTDRRFAVAGERFAISLGRAMLIGDIPTSALRRFCSSSSINLNITSRWHTEVHASSTARPFELAAMGCCIVSCPYKGLDKWFENGREMVILSEDDSVNDVYESILSDSQTMERMGRAARERVVKEHTYRHRAESLVSLIRNSRGG